MTAGVESGLGGYIALFSQTNNKQLTGETMSYKEILQNGLHDIYQASMSRENYATALRALESMIGNLKRKEVAVAEILFEELPRQSSAIMLDLIKKLRGFVAR